MVKTQLDQVDTPLNKERLKDAHYLKGLCDAARDDVLTLYTSTLTLAECTHIDGKITEDIKQLFEKFLASGEVVVPIMADFHIGIAARDLRWNHDIKLSGADAIHIASAISVKCEEFITTDERIKNRKKLIVSIPHLESLGLKIVRASQTSLLPTEYLQNDLFSGQNESREKTENENTAGE
jgi:predicted nucleic acid-binding protein